MIVILKVNRALITIFLSWLSAQVALADTYCFEKTLNLQDVKTSIGFLLLPNDIVQLQIEENCIAMLVSHDRGKLFEKYLSKRYNLLSASQKSETTSVVESTSCTLDFKTTTKKNSESNTAKLGQKNNLNKAINSSVNESTMQILLNSGLQGELEAGTQRLKIICRLTGDSSANLTFSFADIGRGSVKSEVKVSRGEWLNIASVIKELNENNTNLGIPQNDLNEVNGKSETKYELQFK